MMLMLRVIVFLTSSSLILSHTYGIVRLSSNSTAYLILHGVAKQILDEATIVALGFKPEALEEVTPDRMKYMKIGEAIPLIKANDGSADEVTRVAILKSHAVMGNIIHDIQHIGYYTNPSVLKFQGRSLLVTGSNNGKANSKATEQGLLEFRWLNTTRHPLLRSPEKYLGVVTTEVEPLATRVYGEDPRVIMLGHDRFQVYFVNPFVPVTRIGMMEVALNYTSRTLEVVRAHKEIQPPVREQRQKNWTPFVHKVNDTDVVYLVTQVNPLVVVRPTLRDGELHAEIVSTDALAEVDWPYGLIRGGTNAVLLHNRGEYLSFMHSKGILPGGSMNTYFVGAYTFSATAPFRLLGISALPMMPGEFYTGAWSPMKNARIDYCFFPTSIYLEGGDIVMTAGFQDSNGFVMRLALKSVLDTLVPVSPVDHQR